MFLTNTHLSRLGVSIGLSNPVYMLNTITRNCTSCGRIKSKNGQHTCPTSAWNKGLKGVQTSHNKGKKLSETTKQRISSTRNERISLGLIQLPIGEHNGMYGKSSWNKGRKGVQVSAMKGKHFSKEVREKISGANHYNWKGGVGSENMKFRKSYEYKLWRQAVFARDKWTCVFCGEVGGRLNADHIKPFSVFTELRLAIDNGRTLCVPCHKKTDTYLKSEKYIRNLYSKPI